MEETCCFEDALHQVKHFNGKICRSGWNGKGLHVQLLKTSAAIEGDPQPLPYLEMVYPKFETAEDGTVFGNSDYPNGARFPWFASQTDLLAEDWIIISAENMNKELS